MLLENGRDVNIPSLKFTRDLRLSKLLICFSE